MVQPSTSYEEKDQNKLAALSSCSLLSDHDVGFIRISYNEHDPVLSGRDTVVIGCCTNCEAEPRVDEVLGDFFTILAEIGFEDIPFGQNPIGVTVGPALGHGHAGGGCSNRHFCALFVSVACEYLFCFMSCVRRRGREKEKEVQNVKPEIETWRTGFRNREKLRGITHE
ncbi:hypothetical protein L228DRAFT_3120 [Xylona heveae TC161]|uniref:Uncharacterized protein n=1 Tax=Xylona heveae (strain CBS 132557 / TC161) TaxID=1328760 RepID=A0A165JBJ8_XYLHT|nr:hypothetical protein L228DRAFT_3120 [Xylona heveae TC161]KZF26014.1 hypothetical protein L228DRAFT_3120 [Xylona heveae TC161]